MNPLKRVNCMFLIHTGVMMSVCVASDICYSPSVSPVLEVPDDTHRSMESQEFSHTHTHQSNLQVKDSMLEGEKVWKGEKGEMISRVCAMGVIYHVVCVVFPLQVAIKSIRKENIKDEQDLTHIRREIEIMSSLNHPYIITVYEGRSEV